MLGGELVTLAPQLVVVRQVGSAAARAPGRHVVGEQPGEPETVVAQMHTQQEPALAGVVQAGEIRHQVDEIVVALVVGAADPPAARASATRRKPDRRKRPRTLARIMRKPPSKAAPPRPRPPSSRAPAAAPAPGPRTAADLLTRLTTLAQELTGAFRPATVVELL